MESQPKTEIVIQRDLTTAAIPFILNAYKHGLFDMGEVYTKQSFLDKIEKNCYAVFHKANESGKEILIMQLTQKGATFVQNNFIDMLTELSPYYLFPIIKRGDRVTLLRDIQNKFDEKTGTLKTKVISGPSGANTLDKGIYVVQACDAGSISITDDCSVLYRLRLAGNREDLKMCAEDLRPESEELQDRFGIIRVQALVERLQDKINTIKLAELVDELYSMPHTKDRLSNV